VQAVLPRSKTIADVRRQARVRAGLDAPEPDEKARQVTEAIERFRQLATYFPERKEGHVSLIKALHTAGRTEEAVAAIQRAHQRWPGDTRFKPMK